MPTFKYDKLVRDKIWSWHEECGHNVKGKILAGEDLQKALCKKLHEESDEVDAAILHKDLVEEISDIQQIINDMCELNDITKEDLDLVMLEKKDRKGGFAGGMHIETVSMPDEDDKWAKYCRDSPDKYPEIKET